MLICKRLIISNIYRKLDFSTHTIEFFKHFR